MNFTIIDYKEVVETLWSKSSIFMTSDVSVPKIFVGADPGSRNLGISIYVGNLVIVNQIKMKAEKNPVQSMVNIMEAVKSCIPYKTNFGIAIVEGSSYNEKFGQTALSEARSAIMIALYQLNFTVKKMAPLQIRKLATGKGTEKCLGLEFPPDATASFLACLVALQLDELFQSYNPS